MTIHKGLFENRHRLPITRCGLSASECLFLFQCVVVYVNDIYRHYDRLLPDHLRGISKMSHFNPIALCQVIGTKKILQLSHPVVRVTASRTLYNYIKEKSIQSYNELIKAKTSNCSASIYQDICEIEQTVMAAKKILMEKSGN